MFMKLLYKTLFEEKFKQCIYLKHFDAIWKSANKPIKRRYELWSACSVETPPNSRELLGDWFLKRKIQLFWFCWRKSSVWKPSCMRIMTKWSCSNINNSLISYIKFSRSYGNNCLVSFRGIILILRINSERVVRSTICAGYIQSSVHLVQNCEYNHDIEKEEVFNKISEILVKNETYFTTNSHKTHNFVFLLFLKDKKAI